MPALLHHSSQTRDSSMREKADQEEGWDRDRVVRGRLWRRAPPPLQAPSAAPPAAAYSAASAANEWRELRREIFFWFAFEGGVRGMSGYIGGAPPPAASRREVISEKFPEAVASGRVHLDTGDEAPAQPAAGLPQGGYKVRTLAEQLADNRRQADDDFQEEHKPKGPKGLDDEEFEFLEGTQLAGLRKRLLEEAEEKEALAEFHARKATLVHDAADVWVFFL